ncbi:2178_t:CDS:2 [Ambispora leptoticha]|uniref:2178_t:CDS:1 n=1 Tax=Ambispora leptoticha TaxID=144679 RepID=A0A9N8VK69_9GLOM|nr:2178_t:CDS:2 [Ambispora leptoticha]
MASSKLFRYEITKFSNGKNHHQKVSHPKISDPKILLRKMRSKDPKLGAYYYTQTQAQPISLLHPTSYHLEQTQLRSKRGQSTSNDGAPPTPSNSFTNNNTIDPESPDITQDLDFGDPSSTIMSPLSNASPIGSPSQNSFEPDEYIDTGSQFGESPGTQPSIYSPGPDNTDFYFDTADFSTSAPASAIDVKTITAQKFFNNRTHNNSNGFASQYPVSMSLPVTLNQAAGTEWFGTSLDQSSGFAGAHPSSLQFPSGDMPPILGNDFLQEEENAEKRALLNEKRRKRRESHNAVERRRRDNINEKIQELSTLLPDLYNDSANKPNKGVILRKSVDYIRDLKKIVDQQGARNQELEALVRDLQSKMNASSLDGTSGG